MKKILLLLVVLYGLSFTTKAQDNTFGGGISFFSEAYFDMVSLHARYNHYINDEFRVVPIVDLGFGDANIFSVGGGANFLPEILRFDDFQLYFSGLLDLSVLFKNGYSETGLGIRLDFFGLQYDLDNISLFAESGWRIGGPAYYDPWVISVGAFFDLDF